MFGYKLRAEGAFSDIKRILREYVAVGKFVHIEEETAVKAYV